MPLPDLANIHELYLSLARIADERFAKSLGGKLLISSGFDAEGIATVVASSIAGAASLRIDGNAERLREGLRNGFCDFVVSHLDEALRILKNELRQARPVSVGLTADPESSLREIVERGLQPDLLSVPPSHPSHRLLERGAVALPAENQPEAHTSLLEWSAAAEPARAMPRIAQLVLDALDPARGDTTARRRWLSQSSRYLGRAFASRQCLRLTSREIAVFLPLLRERFPAISITRDGKEI